jgi:hypothetical protein
METETASLEGHLDRRFPAPMILRKADVPNAAALIRRGRWQVWLPELRPDRPSTYVVTGESHSSGTAESKGEAGLLIRDSEITQKSRIGTGTLPLAISRVQIDREQKKYALAVSLLEALGDSRIPSIQSSWHEHSQPSGFRETRSETLRGSTLVVNGKLGAHSDVEFSPAEVMVFDRALPDKVGLLQGSIDIPLVPGRERHGKVDKEVRKAVLYWSFSPTPPPPIDLEIEVVSTSAGTWPDWRPRATWVADSPGGHVDIAARVVSRGGPLPDKPVKIALRLAEVSSEPGICVNFPEPAADAPNGRPDLRFISNGNSEVKVTDLSAWTIKPPKPELQARLASFDYGGWADVMAEAYLESGRILVGRLKGKPGERRLLVPDRDPASKIARCWKSPGKDDEDLDDQPPGDGQAGDGFSNYEEYRGFRVGKVWKDGDPAKKEFFVRNEAPVLGAGGVALFEAITNLRVHRVDADEIRSSDRVVNFNKGHAHVVDQHGVRIFFDPNLKGACWAEGDGKPGLPKGNVGGVHIGVFENRDVDTVVGGGVTRRPYVEPSLAHELLHCCNVYHHGDKPGDADVLWSRNAAGTVLQNGTPIRVLDEAGAEISAKLTVNSLGKMNIGDVGGRSSGDVGCVMRYDAANAYRIPGRPDDRVRLGPGDPPEQIGGGLCRSPAATGNNVSPPGRFGAADVSKNRGNCAGQIVVRDNATRTDRGK